MLGWLRAIHQESSEQWFEDTCRILRWDVALRAWVEVEANVPCNVQTPSVMGFSSTRDADAASTEDVDAIVVYLGTEPAVEVGMLVEWDGGRWDVTSTAERGSFAWGQSLTCTKMQSALLPEAIAFRRRQAGMWVEVGTFEMRFTEGVRGQTEGQTGEGGTAAGNTMRGSMIGPLAAEAVQIGDWFSRDGMPGRVVGRDDSETDHIEFEYLQSVGTP